MKYICNRCGNVTQEQDVIIHYTKGTGGLEIAAVCQHCLEKYLEKIKSDVYTKSDEDERMKMKRKW